MPRRLLLAEGVECQQRRAQRVTDGHAGIHLVQQVAHVIKVRIEIAPRERVLGGVVAEQGAAGDPASEWMGTPPPTWEDIAWLRELWGGPFMLKGVMRVDDAKRAVDAGVSAISVSNHGGNNLDGTPASIRALPAIADAVGDQIEVLLDGGIRRGSDVVKALALGARAVMIGRAYLWGLAAEGPGRRRERARRFARRHRLDADGSGRASVHDLVAGDVVVPPGFTRALGVPAAPEPDGARCLNGGGTGVAGGAGVIRWRAPAEISRERITAHAPTIGAPR